MGAARILTTIDVPKGRRERDRRLQLHTTRWQSRDSINIYFWTHHFFIVCLFLLFIPFDCCLLFITRRRL